RSPHSLISASLHLRVSPSPRHPLPAGHPGLKPCRRPRLAGGYFLSSLRDSPRLPISVSPHLPISVSPHLPISVSPHLPISVSPHLPISVSPHLPIAAFSFVTRNSTLVILPAPFPSAAQHVHDRP